MRFLTITRDDVRVVLRDKSAVFWLFVAPFLWVYFFGHLAGGGPDPSKTKIGLEVVDRDGTQLSRSFVEALRGENLAVHVASPAAPGQSGKPEDASPRTLSIPAGFAQAVAGKKETHLELSESRDASPNGTLAVKVAIHKASVRLLAGRIFGSLEPGDDKVTIKSSWAAGRKVPSGYYQTVPGYMVMFIVLQALTIGAAGLTRDRQAGLLSRLAATPLRKSQIVAGKIAARSATALMQAGVLIVLGLTVFRIDWGRSPLGLAAVILTLTFAAAGISLLSGTLFKSADGAAGIGVVLALIMSALGGCWWPAEVMPPWLRTASHVLPTAWAMDGLNQLISWGGGLSDAFLPSAVLFLFGLAASSLAVHRLKLAR